MLQTMRTYYRKCIEEALQTSERDARIFEKREDVECLPHHFRFRFVENVRQTAESVVSQVVHLLMGGSFSEPATLVELGRNISDK